jgi:hypothetical protein
MNKKFQQKLIFRLFVIFILVNITALIIGNWLDEKRIDHVVLIGANSLLFLLATISLLMQSKAMRNSNPNVFVRSIMAGTFLKLMVIIAALFIYAFTAGKNRSLGAIFTGMALYIIYTVVEVRSALQLNRMKDGSN